MIDWLILKACHLVKGYFMTLNGFKESLSLYVYIYIFVQFFKRFFVVVFFFFAHGPVE